MVTQRPPHRSVRAALLHTTPTRGVDAKPLRGMRMDDSAWWEISVKQPREARPRQASALTSMQQCMSPCAPDFLKEPGQPTHVVRHRVVVQISPEYSPQPLTYHRHRFMTPPHQRQIFFRRQQRRRKMVSLPRYHIHRDQITAFILRGRPDFTFAGTCPMPNVRMRWTFQLSRYCSAFAR